MILVDTSVWIDHLHTPDKALVSLLDKGEVLIHPFVIGELALGQIKNRGQVLRDLRLMPQTTLALDPEVLDWVERHRLSGKGLNWVDAHLLLSCRLNSSGFWTRDKILLTVGRATGVDIYSSR